MANSISEAQKTYDYTIGDNPEMYDNVVLNKTEEYLVVAGHTFLQQLSKIYNERKIKASGKLISDGRVDSISPTQVQIVLPYYFDFPNEGVKGVKSFKNAPNSPYSFKNYGMSQDGRKSIKQYIESGKAVITSVRNDKALGVGTEKKGLSLIDAKTETMIYLIKRYGIKTTNYFNDAVTIFKKDFV